MKTRSLGAAALALLFPFAVRAQTGLQRLQGAGQAAGYKNTTDKDEAIRIVGTVIHVFLDVAGVIFLILIVFAGYRWMTAGGNEEGVTKAKETLQRAVIGLAIVLLAYAMSIFIINSLIVSTVTIKAGP